MKVNDNTADTVARCDPDVVVSILGNATDIVVAQVVTLGNVIELVILHVQNVQTFACTYPQQFAAVLKNLGNIAVGESRLVAFVADEV